MNIAKLKGFNYPLTPKGKSTLNPPPPWYYSSDFIDVEFWAQPAAVASLLPNGLEPDPAANGHCNALFYDWQFSGANEEYLDPARYQYREFFILVDALFEGRSVSYCPYIFVDNDAALARG
jgi:Acetoacetate decarboxylase (ADC)